MKVSIRSNFGIVANAYDQRKARFVVKAILLICLLILVAIAACAQFFTIINEADLYSKRHFLGMFVNSLALVAVTCVAIAFAIREARLVFALKKATRENKFLQRANNERKLLEKRYHNLSNAHDLFVIRHDASENISAINETLATWLGISAREWNGRPFRYLVSLINDKQADAFGAIDVEKPAITGTVADGNEQLLRSKNGDRWVRWQVSPIDDGEGLTVERQYVGADITYTKLSKLQREEYLEQGRTARLAKSQFLAMVSHEIRTPLNGILGMAELLLLCQLKPVEKDYCHAIQKSALALLSLIDEILDLASVEAGKFTVEQSPYDLSRVMLDAAELVSPRANTKNLDVAVYIDPYMPVHLIGDETRIRQVILNLAGNAIKFTQSGGVTIEARMRQQDSSSWEKRPEIEFNVRDTGEGIPEGMTDKLFEPFEQANSTRTKRHGGTGLGLSISRHLVHAMGGTISAASEAGRGSVFTVRMPMLRDTSKSPPSQPGALDIRMHSYIVATRLPRQTDLIIDLFGRLGANAIRATDGNHLQRLIKGCIKSKRNLAEYGTKLVCDTLIISRTFGGQKVEQIIEEFGINGPASPIRVVVLASAREMLSATAMDKYGHAWLTTPHSTDSFLNAILASHSYRHPVQISSSGTLLTASCEAEEGAQDDSSANGAASPDQPPAAAAKLTLAAKPAKKDAQPIARRLVSAAEPAKAATSRQASAARHHILIAEDNATNARITSAFMRHLGQETALASNGTEAVRWVEKRLAAGDKIDLILMDVRMPEMDGLEATRNIRELLAGSSVYQAAARVPIFALTANAHKEDMEECLNSGMDGVLVKPVTVIALREKIEMAAPYLLLPEAAQQPAASETA